MNSNRFIAMSGTIVALTLSASASAQTITTDLSAYSTGDSLVATWSGVDSGIETFIAIGRPQDSDEIYLYWQGTPLADSGSRTFTHLPAGERFEMRVYLDNGLEVVARSAEFSVANSAGSTTLDADQSVYNPGDDMEFTWTGGPGYALDWLAVILEGSPEDAYLAWTYTDGDYDGSRNWSDLTYNAGVTVLPPFCYDALYMVNDMYDVAASDSFCVEMPPGSSTITTDAPEYTPATPVDVCWSDAPGNPLDWVGIAKRALSPIESYSYTDIYGNPLWVYTGGTVEGCLSTHTAEGSFTGDKILGNYAARGFADNTYLAFANQALFVVNFANGSAEPVFTSTLTTDKTVYFVGEPVAVTYSSLPGNDLDVLHLATTDFQIVPDGGGTTTANDPAFIADWSYMRGSTEGTESFYKILEPGTYSAWAMVDDKYDVIGQSDTFEVILDESLAPHVWSIPTCIFPGTPDLFVAYDNILLGGEAWIGIFDAGSPADAFSLVWSWMGEAESGSGVLPTDFLAEGTYEIRILDGDREIAVQSTLVVSAECPVSTVTRDRDFYQVGDTITASFSDFNGHEDEMVGYQQVGLDPVFDPYEASGSTGSAISGAVEFVASTPGTYLARGFMEWSKFVTAESAEFIICPIGQVPDCNGVCTNEGLIDPFECDTGVDTL